MGEGWTHERSDGNEEWLTPRFILEALGEFDLDPCAPVTQPWPTAKKVYTKIDDGMQQEWFGRVWLNPPYGARTNRWLARLRTHGNGIALIFARTDTSMFFNHVWGHADGAMFLAGRLAFCDLTGAAGARAGAPSVLIAYGAHNVEALERSKLDGYVVRMTPKRA